MYLVYKTDAHHSYASRDIIGCTRVPSVAIQICCDQAKKEGSELTVADMYNLNNIKQTQGYDGDGEFQYEWIEEDVLL